MKILLSKAKVLTNEGYFQIIRTLSKTDFNKEQLDLWKLQFKAEKEELIIRRLESKFPGIRKAIRNVYSSSPLTYKDYIGTPDGSLYGIMKDYRNPVSKIVNTKTRIPNLYLTGQNIVFHGILGVTIGAFLTCFNFVDKKKLIEDIRSYE